MDTLTTIILSGTEALAERQRLLDGGREVSLVCRRRDSRGADVSRSFFFGLSSEGAWVAVQDLKNPDDIGVEIAFPHQARELFARHVERVMAAKMLTNSDPRSHEWFDLEPDISTFTAELKAAFDVEVSPWG